MGAANYDANSFENYVQEETKTIEVKESAEAIDKLVKED